MSRSACDSTRELEKTRPPALQPARRTDGVHHLLTTGSTVSGVKTSSPRSSHFHVDAESVAESFVDNHCARHLFMAIAAEHVA
jgi:hypothetical protein